MSKVRYAGRFEVAIDSFLDLRVYPKRGRAPGEEPWIKRLQDAPRDPTTISFEGRRFTWHPGKGGVLPVVTMPIEDSENYTQEQLAMERFLSALSFQFGYGITVYGACASGFRKELDPPLLHQPRMKPTVYPVPASIELADESKELSLCLRIVREGLSSSSPALAFLSFWKAVEVAVGDPDFKGWIGPAAVTSWPEAGLTARQWFGRLNETRVAAAHALPRGKGLRYDPDDPSLGARLREDLSRIHDLARRAIEERWPRPVTPRGPRY